jgi:hypothetical protein
VRPPPVADVWKARLRATLMPVLVGVTALLATVVVGRLRQPAGPVVSSGAALPRRAPTVVIGGPTAPAAAATSAISATSDSPEGTSAGAPEAVAPDLIVVAAPEPPALPRAPSPSPPAEPRLEAAVQAPAAPGSRLTVRQRPPRPIDSDSPYAP